MIIRLHSSIATDTNVSLLAEKTAAKPGSRLPLEVGKRTFYNAVAEHSGSWATYFILAMYDCKSSSHDAISGIRPAKVILL